MSKETPEIVTECWQLLVEYIPRRDHISAAEQLVSYLESILDKDELQAIADLDSDLAFAYKVVRDENPDVDESDEDSEYED